MTPEDDSRIDPSKIAALYEQYSEDVRRFLHRVLRDADQADEVLQLRREEAADALWGLGGCLGAAFGGVGRKVLKDWHGLSLFYWLGGGRLGEGFRDCKLRIMAPG